MASSAENSFGVPFSPGPDLDGVPSQRVMAILARVIDAAAPHLNGDDVDWFVVVNAAGLRINLHAANFWSSIRHLRMPRSLFPATWK